MSTREAELAAFIAARGDADEKWWATEHDRTGAKDWALQEIAGKRQILAVVAGMRHLYVDGDCWYSCARAVRDPAWDADDLVPGSGCCDDDRRGGPCDCGRDSLAEAILAPLAAAWNTHPGYRALADVTGEP
jgi:hypothetical protein